MHPRLPPRPGAGPARQPGPLPRPLSARATATASCSPPVPEFGVYLHVPFCAARCDYCAFATWTDRHHLQGAYLDACASDIARAVAAGLPAATSIFVGGGTPSLLPATDLAAVLAVVPRAAGCEVTVEANPDTVTPELVEGYVAAGVTRVSLGVQSMAGHVLRSLGRAHDPGNVRRAVSLVRGAGIATFNLDLIYGGAGESVDDWRRTLEEALALDPPHVSAYALTVEPGTPLAGDPGRHPDDDDQADKYLVAVEVLEGAGLGWYELSNWARPGHECRHNRLYWTMGDYQAFGCAGHSHRGGRRSWNVRTPERYIAAVTAGSSPEAAGERLDPDGRRLEGLQLALRTRQGVPAATLPVDQLGDLVEVTDGRAVLTLRGRLLANEVAVRLR
ncbi:MAG TPA: radical SAM family heme chaperone HemW [Acidimicrobiales bacterium]|nr:radical SAM family heme chaperone HemW [Acidimicrobiales bacterium]